MPHRASVLLQGRESANIQANLGVIWEIPVNMRAVQLTAFGNPVEGLEYVDIPEPDAPGPNEVLIGVEFSPINPNDLMVAQGIYAFRPPLPAVIGNEGVGRVLALVSVRQHFESFESFVIQSGDLIREGHHRCGQGRTADVTTAANCDIRVI